MFSKKITPDLFRKMRLQAGLSQEELAKEMGCTRRTISERETNETKMTLADFERFILICNKDGEDEKRAQTVLGLISSALDILITKESEYNTAKRVSRR